MPRVLLSAPVNATWAANHADYWLSKGIHGFLLHGILDVCEGSVWSRDGAPDSTGADDALLLEVRFAQQRLADAGIAENFLFTQFASPFRAFERPSDADAFITALGEAAEFVQRAGLQGLAIDTTSSELPFHPQWDGYTLRGSAQLREAAISLGRRMVQAIASRAPQSQFLIIYDGPSASGPMWPALFEGIVRGARTSRFRRLHMLTRATLDVVAPAPFMDALALERDFLALHLPADVLEYWTEHGAIAPGLRPIHQPQPGGEIYAAYSDDQFRVQTLIAKLAAPAYVWIESAGQTWWQVDPKEAPSYVGLHQLGDDVQRQTKSLPAYLAGLAATTPIDEFSRVEAVTTPLPDHTVVTASTGAAVVLWPGHTLTLDTDERPQTVLDIATGTAGPAPEDGIPIHNDDVPLLIQGLSVSHRVVPASLWFAYGHDALERWESPLPIAFGFTNRSTFSIDGVVDLLPPLRWDVPTAHNAFSLEPSQRLEVQSVLRGAWHAGERLVIRSSVAIPGAPVRTRSWTLDVAPMLAWRAIFPGTMVSDPVWRDLDADGRAEILVTSSGGDFACWRDDGATLWTMRSGRGYTLAPAAGRTPAGWEAVAGIDREGTLSILRGDGQLVVEQNLSEPPSQPLLMVDVHPFAGDELVVALPSGLVQVWRMDGVKLWEQSTKIPDPFIAATPQQGEMPPSIVVAGEAISVLDGNGAIALSIELPSPSSCPPAIGDFDANGVREFLVGLADGSVARVEDEAVTTLTLADGRGAVRQITTAPDGTVLVTAGNGVHAYDRLWKRRWFWEGPNVHACVPIHGLRSPRYLIAENAPVRVLCVSAHGVVEWRDSAPLWGPVSAPAARVAGKLVRLAYGCADGALRVREFHAGE